MELREYLSVLRARWSTVITVVVLTTLSLVGASLLASPSYRASTLIVASTAGPDNGVTAVAQQRLQTYATLVQEGPVAAAVVQQLGLPISVVEMQSKVSASVLGGSFVLRVTAADPSATRATEIAASAARSLVTLVNDEEKPRADAESVRLSIAQGSSPAINWPLHQLPRNVIFATLLACLIGVGVSAIQEAIRRPIRTSQDVRSLLGVEVLAVIPPEQASRRDGFDQSNEVDRRLEAFRLLRARLQSAIASGDTRAVLVTGITKCEGVTNVTCALASAFARSAVRVVLVDGNLRRPSVAEYFTLDSDLGLSDVLSGAVPLDDAVQAGVNEGLSVLPAGRDESNARDLLGSGQMSEVMKSLERQFDLVLIDAPPVPDASDAAVLAGVADHIVLVVRPLSVHARQGREAVDAFRGMGASVVGAVLDWSRAEVSHGSRADRQPRPRDHSHAVVAAQYGTSSVTAAREPVA